jgi:hypothetical protein
MSAAFTPVLVKMGPEETQKRLKYVEAHLESLCTSLKSLHTDKYERWRKLYEGKPKEEKKSFPWPGASNLVIQVIAQHVDTLLAAIIGSIYEIAPLWPLTLVGDYDAAEKAEEARNAMEEFLTLKGLEQSELDVYRVENIAFGNAIKYGMNAIKIPYLVDVEADGIGVRDGGGMDVTEFTRYAGPRPESIPFDKFLITPSATKLETAPFKAHKITLKRFELEERMYRGIYDKEKVECILTSPDRGGADATETSKQADGGIASKNYDGVSEEWDIYECHYPYWYHVDGKYMKFRIIETFHRRSKTSLRAMFNPMPNNDEQFVICRLGYDDRGMYGYGWCEMLEHAQEEVSAEHNRSADNNTLANVNALRVDPDSLADSQFSIYPLCVLPFAKDKMEILQLGRQNNTGVDRENQMFNIIKARTGVDNGISGSGSGVTNPKRGVYSAMGTFAVMQAGNRRTNIRTTDMRAAHIEIGRKCLQQYAHFGVGDSLKGFGKDAAHLERGLKLYEAGKLTIPVKSATASVNRELEKQNDIMLVNIAKQHYQGIAGILQNLGMVPPEQKEYMIDVCFASDALMRRIFKNFGHDDVSRLLPMPAFLQQAKEQLNGGAKGNGANNGAGGPVNQNNGANRLSPFDLHQQGSNPSVPGNSGGESIHGVPQQTPGGVGGIIGE